MLKKLFISLILILLVSCSAKEANVISDDSVPAGFRKSADGVYVKSSHPDVLKNYRAFYVNPINIYKNDKGRLSPPTQREVDMLAKKFRDKIVRQLGSRYTHFNQPTHDVAIIDINVVDVWSTRSIEAIRPGLVIPNNFSGGATIEVNFYDSITKSKVATIWDSRPGERQGLFSGFTKWGATEAAFDEWSVLLKKSIRKSYY